MAIELTQEELDYLEQISGAVIDNLKAIDDSGYGEDQLEELANQTGTVCDNLEYIEDNDSGTDWEELANQTGTVCDNLKYIEDNDSGTDWEELANQTGTVRDNLNYIADDQTDLDELETPTRPHPYQTEASGDAVEGSTRRLIASNSCLCLRQLSLRFRQRFGRVYRRRQELSRVPLRTGHLPPSRDYCPSKRSRILGIWISCK
jgi:hypothetical protein